MIDFDFIIDDRFRDSLTADYAEFKSCLTAEAWKAALVLVGSIVEALLVDHLLATNYQKKTGKDPLKMQLGEMIQACEGEKLLSPTTASLSAVVRNYRNLIHPGRSVRLGETASRSAAVVAGELLQMIVDDISAKKRALYGYTADQIIKKLERDESAISIHKHLLKEVPQHELDRLLLKVIPKRYFELDTAAGEFEPEPDLAGQNRLAMCFRSAFEMCPDETKKKITLNFVSILKSEDQHRVFTYETAFFRAGDLQHLAPSDAKLVKDHLLSRVYRDLSYELVEAMEGLPTFLVEGDISDLVDALLRGSLLKGPTPLRDAARKFLTKLWEGLKSKNNGSELLVINRLEAWISHYEQRDRQDLAETVREIRMNVDGIPF